MLDSSVMRILPFILIALVGCTMAIKTDLNTIPKDAKVATFAGGCFWCMEPPFEKLDGVYAVISGYAGGEEPNPTYEQVSSGRTGHIESVQIFYDQTKVTYEELLDIFWRNIDPTDPGGQFVDRGKQYRSAIFYHDDEQKGLAEKSKADLEASGRFDKPMKSTIRTTTRRTRSGTNTIAADQGATSSLSESGRVRAIMKTAGRVSRNHRMSNSRISSLPCSTK